MAAERRRPPLLAPPAWPEARAVPGLALAHGAGAVGGVAASLIGAPLPWLLGGLFASALVVVATPEGVGGAPWRPANGLRNLFVVVIGGMIGGAFTPELLAGAAGWGPSLLGLAIYTLAAHGLIYAAYRRLGMGRATAWFAAAPGGLIENIMLGEQAGGDVRRITLLQFGRIAAAVTLVPLAYSAWLGEAVGSAAGARFEGGEGATGRDLLVLVGAGLGGVLGARALRVPAGVIVGPVLASAAAHGTGLTAAQVPANLVALAQLVIGVGLGLRFGGLTARELGLALSISGLGVAATLALALGAALLAAPFASEGAAVLVLAYAPGGIIEMGLIALSLGASPVFVTAHHVLRLLLTVTVSPWIFRRALSG